MEEKTTGSATGAWNRNLFKEKRYDAANQNYGTGAFAAGAVVRPGVDAADFVGGVFVAEPLEGGIPNCADSDFSSEKQIQT